MTHWYYILLTDPVPLCINPLGMQDGAITDTQVTGSSILGTLYPTYSARLWHADGLTYGFIPSSYTSTNRYIEVDLQRVVWVSGVIMQGIDSPQYQCWTKRYIVQYSLDRKSWPIIQDEHNTSEVRLL